MYSGEPFPKAWIVQYVENANEDGSIHEEILAVCESLETAEKVKEEESWSIPSTGEDYITVFPVRYVHDLAYV